MTNDEYDRFLQIKEKLSRDRVLTASDHDCWWLFSQVEVLLHQHHKMQQEIDLLKQTKQTPESG